MFLVYGLNGFGVIKGNGDHWDRLVLKNTSRTVIVSRCVVFYFYICSEDSKIRTFGSSTCLGGLFYSRSDRIKFF